MNYLHYDDVANRIFVSTNNGMKDDIFRNLPGCRWLPAQRIWSMPGTPMVAVRVVNTIIEHKMRYDPTKNFLRLLQQAELQFEKAPVKEAVDLPLPPIHKYKPWLHQLRAYHFARELPAAMLAMDMGTGKTKVVYDIIQNTPWIKRVLVGCPKTVIRDAWYDQFDEHWALETGSVLALDEGTQLERANRAYDYLCEDGEECRIVVVNYDILWQPTFGSFALSGEWDLIVLDESHRVRSAGGKTSKYVFRLGEKAKKRMCLSGTPMANTPLDVYGQYRFLDAGIFGTNKQRFYDEFAVMGGYQNYEIIGIKNEEELNRRFYSIAFHVGDDAVDLPPTHDILRKAKLEPLARKLYDEFDKEFTAEVAGGNVTADNVLVKNTRLSQITSGTVKLEDGQTKEVSRAKRDLLNDVLLDIDKHEPLIVFARYHQDLDNIVAVCKKQGRSVGELSGRRNDRAAWKRGDIDVMAVQSQAGSEGSDFTRAKYAIFYSLGFDLYEYKQARKRVHRPKQTRPVTFIHLLITNTIDIDIMAAIRKKRNIIDYIMDLRKRLAA